MPSLDRHDFSLRGLSTEFARQAGLLVGEAWPGVEHRANTICSLYCRRARDRWGIELTPIVIWHEDEQRIEMDVRPKTEMDEAMLDRLKRLEGID